MQENGEANGEVKEPVDPAAPKKCDVIVLSGRKERCEAAVEALKVSPQGAYFSSTFLRNDKFMGAVNLCFTMTSFLGFGSCQH